MSGGVSAAPNPKPAVCMPCTKAQRLGGNQASKTPEEMGKMPPWDTPSSSCTPINAANRPCPLATSGTIGMAMVAANATSSITTNATRAPNRWPMRPPGI